MNKTTFPRLDYKEWESTNQTLHLFLQVVGKIRLYTFPKMNHWWHVPFYVSTRGLTTRPIPCQGRAFELEFDFDKHALLIDTSDGAGNPIPLVGQTVSSFFEAVNSRLQNLNIEVDWKQPMPYDVPFSTEPFATDNIHRDYQPEYVNRYWQILVGVEQALHEFRGRFTGKSTPPHLFWHHMDLALTFFNGQIAPERPGTNTVEREAYSREVISFGFWAGDSNVPAPAFYGYAAPAGDGLYDQPIGPEKAVWNAEAGMALLMYDDIRTSEDPNAIIIEFLQSVYNACARAGSWDKDLLV